MADARAFPYPLVSVGKVRLASLPEVRAYAKGEPPPTEPPLASDLVGPSRICAELKISHSTLKRRWRAQRDAQGGANAA